MHVLTGSGSPSPKNRTKSWDRPSVDFDEFVGQVIAHRLGKYKQPGHPNQISQDDYKELYKKSRRAIIDAERKVSLAPSIFTTVLPPLNKTLEAQASWSRSASCFVSQS